MASQVDPLGKVVFQVNKSGFSHQLQTSKSSQVIGRKINNASLTLKAQKNKKFRPNIVLLPVSVKKNVSSVRAVTVKRSAYRSLSLSKVLPEKETKIDIPHYVSPARQSKFQREKRKQTSEPIEIEVKPDKKPGNIKHILTDSLYKLHQERQETLKQEVNEKIKQETQREKLKLTNEKIWKKNAKTKKVLDFKHPKPWGSDQRHFKESSDPKYLENEEIRKKIRFEREVMKKEGRKGIGLELYSNVKVKIPSRNNKSEDSQPKSKRSPDPGIALFIKKQKKNRRIANLQIKLEETLKEQERVKALQRLEKTLGGKKLRKKRKKRRKNLNKTGKHEKSLTVCLSGGEKSLELTQRIYKRQEEGFGSSGDDIEPKELVSKQLKALQKRVNLTQDLMKTQAAITIQKWFRAIKEKKRIKLLISRSESVFSSENRGKSEDWLDIITAPHNKVTTKNGFAEEFTEKLLERHAEIEKKLLYSEDSLGSEHLSIVPDQDPSDFSESVDETSSETIEKSSEIEEIAQKEPKTVSKVPVLCLNFLKNSNKKYSESTTHKKSTMNNSDQSDSLSKSTENKPAISFDLKSNTSCNLALEDEKISAIYENIHSENSECKNSETSLQTFNYYPQEESNAKDSLEYESYDSENNKEVPSDSNDPEVSLKFILSKNPEKQLETIERPGAKLINDSDSSEEEWNSGIILPSDTNFSEFQLENPSCEEVVVSRPFAFSAFLNEFSDDLDAILDKEIRMFIESVPFALIEKEIDPSQTFVDNYLDLLMKTMMKNEDEMLEIINTPVYLDPLDKLADLQNSETGGILKFPTLEMILLPQLSTQLKIQLKTLEHPSRQVYLQMIFDCVNESLNYIRPFGTRGLPDPWSPIPSTLFGEGQLKTVFGKIRTFIHKWVTIRSGCYSDENIRNDEEKLQKLREEKLSVLLTQNINDDEKKWLEYEDEETQAKIEVSDILFESLIYETLQLIQTG